MFVVVHWRHQMWLGRRTWEGLQFWAKYFSSLITSQLKDSFFSINYDSTLIGMTRERQNLWRRKNKLPPAVPLMEEVSGWFPGTPPWYLTLDTSKNIGENLLCCLQDNMAPEKVTIISPRVQGKTNKYREPPDRIEQDYFWVTPWYGNKPSNLLPKVSITEVSNWFIIS